jgi:murein DD-endopeptidase MepM/ murein hydrolase activator NlpD
MKLIRILFFLILITLIGYLGMNSDLLTRIEKSAPELGEVLVPSTIGTTLDTIRIEAHDNGSGIKEFSLNLVQGEKTLRLESILYVDPVPTHISEPFMEGINKTFKDGPAELILYITDASLWKNIRKERFKVFLDFSKPKLSVLSRQHIATQGGAEFILVEADDSNLQEVGVKVGEYTFAGIPAEVLDPDFTGSKIYAVLFALPLEIDSPSPYAFARDEAGNMSTSALEFRIKPYRLKDTTPNVSKQFIENKVRPLYNEYVSILPKNQIKEIDETDPVAVFRMVNENYRAWLQKELHSLPLSSKALSAGTFIKPMASATTSNFGESRAYTVDGVPAGGSRHDGLDLASIERDSVVASNDGTVLLSRSFGIYGNTVVLDHGMGLTSLYGHLSSITVSEGEEVTKGQELGRSGATGLAGGDHLHFEFRIGSAPVTPREWWDAHWIKDHVTGKLAMVKEGL